MWDRYQDVTCSLEETTRLKRNGASVGFTSWAFIDMVTGDSNVHAGTNDQAYAAMQRMVAQFCDEYKAANQKQRGAR